MGVSTGRIRPIYFLLLLIVSVSSCKSLEKRCLAKFPASIDHNYSLIIEDSTIPESKLNGNTWPCPEWYNKLPEDGKPVIIAEDDKAQLQAARGKDGKIDLTALVKSQTIKGAKKSESNSINRVMHLPCDCDELVKAAKFDLLIDIGFGCLVLLIVGAGVYFFWKNKQQ
jgi:hypothetical protein